MSIAELIFRILKIGRNFVALWRYWRNNMNKDHRNFYGLSLIEAEKIEAKLHSKISSKDVFGLGAKETLIITNKRIIKVK